LGAGRPARRLPDRPIALSVGRLWTPFVLAWPRPEPPVRPVRPRLSDRRRRQLRPAAGRGLCGGARRPSLRPVIGRAPACHPAWRLSLARRSARLQPPADARPDLGRAAADPGPAALSQRPDARAGL